ncbi:MAG: hypothetical protein OEX04_17740 [Acidimicrobiia bacterium]|nr:hypothetical protein [Acidimicrobiia bacterium]MDH4309315.1 hypothetical protein [Acidimicrobiia bacterium]MDH5293997.1 hypothetical protein [Acidimicrobiia bacterium]
MIGLLKADFLKLRKRWLYWVLLAVLATLMGLAAVFLIVIPSVNPDLIPDIPTFETGDAMLLGAQQAVGQTWFPLILAVVFLGGEVTTPIWATAVTQEARRWMHLVSKLVICSVAAWAGTMAAMGGWALLAALFTEGEGIGAGTWFEFAWKAALTQVTWTALGLGAMALMRNMGIAIGTVLAFSFFEGIGSLWDVYANVSLTGASTALFGNLGAEFAGGFGFGGADAMSITQAVIVVMGWAVLGLGLAITGLAVKDP